MKDKLVSASIVVALLLGAFSLTGCGGDTSSPENVVTAMHEALKAKDKERFKSLLSKEDLKDWKDEQEMKQDSDQEGEYKVGSAAVSGETATVEVAYSKDGKETSKMTYHCVKEDGEWKVAFGKSFLEALKKALGDMGASGSK